MTNILVVDDAVDTAEVLKLLFEACGHVTHIAFDGLQGVAAAKKYEPHIIFLDLDMPVMDGYAAAEAIRRAPFTDDSFIVALTARSGPEVQHRTDAAGFDFSMRKPADTDALLAIVDSLMARERKAGGP